MPLPTDSCFADVTRLRGFLDVFDEEWLKDELSDDEIELPEGAQVPVEEDAALETELQRANEDKWTDMGLDQLTD